MILHDRIRAASLDEGRNFSPCSVSTRRSNADCGQDPARATLVQSNLNGGRQKGGP